MAGIGKTEEDKIKQAREEYANRANAVGGFVKRNMTSDPNATKNSPISLRKPLGGIGGKILETLKSNISVERPLGGIGEKAMGVLFPYGQEGSQAYNERMNPKQPEEIDSAATGSPVAAAMDETGGTTTAPSPVPSVESPTQSKDTAPWSREKRMGYLGLNEGRIIRGGGPGGSDILTNRNTPFENYRSLPSEAYGVGGEEKESYVRGLREESQKPFASARKMDAYRKHLGIGESITPFEQEKLNIEREKIAQDAKQFAKTNDMTNRQNQEKIAMMMGGYTERETLDTEGNIIKSRTPNTEFFRDAFDSEGNFNLQNAFKSVEESKTLQNAKMVLEANKNDPKIAKILKERLMNANISEAKIKEKLGI